MKSARLTITLDRNFESYTEVDRADLLRDVSIQSGVPVNEMCHIRFEKGCTVLSAEFDHQGVMRLLDIFMNSIRSEKDAPFGFKAFIAKHRIILITGSEPRPARKVAEVGYKDLEPAIVFVHGWRGDADSFGNFPEFVAKKTGYRCETYVYPTGIWETSPHIYLIAGNLENWIRNTVPNHDLLFVGHSMGGLVIRKLLTNQHFRTNPLDEIVRNVTFIASPHTGTDWASLAQKVPFLRKAQLQALTPDSPFLLELNEEWLAWSRSNVPINCRTHSIYGSSDDVVPINNAAGFDADAIPILGKGHIDIVKPENIDDEIVKTVVRLLLETGDLAAPRRA